MSTTELKRTEQEGERVEKLLEGERSMWGPSRGRDIVRVGRKHGRAPAPIFASHQFSHRLCSPVCLAFPTNPPHVSISRIDWASSQRYPPLCPRPGLKCWKNIRLHLQFLSSAREDARVYWQLSSHLNHSFAPASLQQDVMLVAVIQSSSGEVKSEVLVE